MKEECIDNNVSLRLCEEIRSLKKEIEEIRNFFQESSDLKPKKEEWMPIESLLVYLPNKPTKATVYGWVSHGKIPYHHCGKRLVFSQSEIDTWISQQNI